MARRLAFTLALIAAGVALAAPGASAAVSAGDIYTAVPARASREVYVAGKLTLDPSYFNDAQGIAFDAQGDMYVADAGDNTVAEIPAASLPCPSSDAPSACYSVVVGSAAPGEQATAGFSGDGAPASAAQLNDPMGIALDGAGNLYIDDSGNHRVRMVPASSGTYFGIPMTAGDIYTIAGDGSEGDSGDGGPATGAQLGVSETIAVGPDGSVYYAEFSGCGCVRKISSATDTITTFASNLGNPLGVAFDPAGNLYVAGTTSNQVYEVTPGGATSVLAGTGTAGYSGDGGPATGAQLDFPHGLALAPDGDVLISDRENCVIRDVSPDGVITTYAGNHAANYLGIQENCVYGGYAGDGGPASAPGAQLAFVEALAEDPAGDLYLSDQSTGDIREVLGEQTAPALQSDPTVSGYLSPGQVLSANPGGWEGTPYPSVSYQWQRCTGSGTGCSSISGQTGSSYTVTSADDGDTLQVSVSASNLVGSAQSSSPPSAVVGPPPQIQTPPSVTGDTVAGDTLSASEGTWTGAPTQYSYQWQLCDPDCDVNIPGASASTYTLSGADAGQRVAVSVTATSPQGQASAQSAQSALIDAPPANDGAGADLPQITGQAVQGDTLSATPGSWTGTPAPTYSYQWCYYTGAPASSPCPVGYASISGASASAYTPSASDTGRQLAVLVSAANAYGSATALSAPTGAVTPAPTAPLIAITQAPSGTSTATSALITYSETGGQASATACTLDGASVPCTSTSASLSGLPAAAHVFTVTVSGPGGSNSASASWTVTPPPPAAPLIAITQAPSGASAATSALITYSETGGEATSTTCTLDRAGVPCTSTSASLSGLSAGAHVFTVTVSGPGGSDSASVSWTVTLPPSPPAAPQVRIASAPSGASTSTSALITYSETGGQASATSCALDGAGVPCTSASASLSGLSVAHHVFTVTVFGPGGSDSASVSWTVTSAPPPPPPSATLLSAGLTRKALTVKLRCAGSGTCTVQVALDRQGARAGARTLVLKTVSLAAGKTHAFSFSLGAGALRAARGAAQTQLRLTASGRTLSTRSLKLPA